MFFYGFDVYAWQRTRINYPFIFGFSTGSELRYREVLLLSTGFTTFLLAGMNVHIIVTLWTHPDPPAGVAPLDPSQHQGSVLADIIPLLLVLVSPKLNEYSISPCIKLLNGVVYCLLTVLGVAHFSPCKSISSATTSTAKCC